MTMERTELSALSRLFSSTVLRQIYKAGKSPAFARLARQTNLLGSPPTHDSVSSFFDAAFHILRQKSSRDEYVYRNAIAERILMGTHSLNTASMLNEFRVEDRVADVVILNGTSTVYEIKSERDTLSRVADQTSTYLRVFAQVYVIAGDDHVEPLLETVAPCVGVMSLSNRQNMSTVRAAQPDFRSMSTVAMLDSIRIAEAKAILRDLGLEVPDVPNTQMYSRLRELFLRLDPRIAHDAMVKILRKTRSSRKLSKALKAVPPSLHAAVLSTRPGPVESDRLLCALDKSLNEALGWG